MIPNILLKATENKCYFDSPSPTTNPGQHLPTQS